MNRNGSELFRLCSLALILCCVLFFVRRRNAEGLIHALETKEVLNGGTLSDRGDWVDGSISEPTRKFNLIGEKLKQAGKIRLGSRKRLPQDDLVCVKAYSRPAAGARAAKVDELRPAEVLLECSEHLFQR